MSDRSLRLFSGAICLASIIICTLVLLQRIDLSSAATSSMQGLIIFTFIILRLKKRSGLCKWDRPVPTYLRVSLLVVAGTGLAIAVYGFHGVGEIKSSLFPVDSSHTLSANFEQGRCVVHLDSTLTEMSVEFCKNFRHHFDVIFPGLWVLFSALIYWSATSCRTVSKAETN